MKSIKYCLSIILLCFFQLSFAQYYSTGSDPSNIKWRQVNSPFFKVVYPDDFEPEAKRFTAILDYLYLYGGYTLKHTPKPIPVLIHSHSAYSNGLVSWAPKRMEIYPTPSQNIFSQDYLEQLAIHEFRHVVQIDKINQGFTRILSYPFGQQATGAVLGLYVPLWFLEGDATLSETTLSKSGRGRLPSFEQEIRAQLLEKESFSYEKAYFGSYRDFVPDHYRMGYLITAGARYKYGTEVWNSALNETGKKSWSLTPFNNGIKKVTGKNKVPLYDEIFNDWQQRWIKQDQDIYPSQLEIISERSENYKNYTYPVVFDQNHIITEVNSLDDVGYFARINVTNGKEEKLLTIGFRNREPFSYANNVICWTELESHPRWENQYFSIIRTYNLETQNQKKITSKSRYYAPVLSPDAQKIATVHISTDNKNEIHILNADNGEVIRVIPTPNNQLPLTPHWNKTAEQIVMVLLTSEGKKLAILDLSTEQWSSISHPTFADVKAPQLIDGYIYFSASWSGIDNIFRIKADGPGLEKITESRFGATQVSKGPVNNSILYQDYSADGYLIAQACLDSLKISTFIPGPLPSEPFIRQLQSQEKGLPDLKAISTNDYTSKKYSKWNIFNFHSWAPVNLNINDATISKGISLMSQNLLSSTFTSVGYNADKQSSREKYHFNISHKAWWPVIELEVKAGNENRIDNNYYVSSTDTFKIDLDQKQQHLYAHLEVNLPLNYTRGKWQRFIQPSISTSYQYASGYSYTQTYYTKINNQLTVKGSEDVNIDAIHARPVNYGLFMYNIHKISPRDVTSKWGQVLELSYRHTPTGGINMGSILGIHTRLYLPGLIPNHSLRLDNDWHKKQKGELYFQTKTQNKYRYFADFAKFPRGINRIDNDQLYSFKGDYIFPLANPDWNIPGVMYLKRITTNLFADYSYTAMHIQDSNSNIWGNYTDHLYSFGTEFRAELHPFRFVFPISLGYRYAYLPNYSKHYNELLLSIGFSGFSVGAK